ncbi:universal stress protein [Haloarchaeobius iranensis]|uniref:Nucleotide-binding universal stress protein, UspA family n=1 Tax=Haloarchaeobius iranensis TaxID=996166 RepID=A0A1G9XB70_9EURY|nr:universal stress protein [Haloarchaeobius iranensis]SDM94000.1 Nucleotide-binding universal stress protein, UspA family [Haloarchaeobius iranensis]
MKVLLGIDGSDESMKTLRKTIDRAREAGDDLTVVVVPKEEAKRSQDEMAAAARDLVTEAGLDVDVRVVAGDPGSTLVDIAERESFDQLAIGGGTESPMGKIRLGPITEFVLLNANVTVRLVR